MILGGVALVALTLYIMSSSKQASMEQAGLTTAEALANQIVTMRRFYTAEVAARARAAGMSLDFDFDRRDKTLPLPATRWFAPSSRLFRFWRGLRMET